MRTPEDRLTEALDQRAADVDVHDRLDAIVDGTAVTHVDIAPPRNNRRLLSVAAAVALLAVGAIAITQVGNVEESSDDGVAVQEDALDRGVLLPVPLSDVDEIADDEWVIATSLPEDYEFQYASDNADGSGLSQLVKYGVGPSQVEEISLRRSEDGSIPSGEPFDVDGTEWTVEASPESRLAARRIGDDVLTVGGFSGTDEELRAMLSDLVVVTEPGLPQAPIAYSRTMTEFGSFEFDGRVYSLRADGSNGWYCDGLFDVDGSGGGGCASFFDPADHLQAYHGAAVNSPTGSNEIQASTYGLTSTAASRIDVEWFDGSVTSVAPQNTSDLFPDVLFWATGATFELKGGTFDAESVVEVRAYDIGGELLATSRDGTLTVE